MSAMQLPALHLRNRTLLLYEAPPNERQSRARSVPIDDIAGVA